MAILTVAELDEAIDKLALGVESYTTSTGITVKRRSLKDLIEYRALRKSQQDGAEGGLVPQYVEFSG